MNLRAQVIHSQNRLRQAREKAEEGKELAKGVQQENDQLSNVKKQLLKAESRTNELEDEVKTLKLQIADKSAASMRLTSSLTNKINTILDRTPMKGKGRMEGQ